MNIFYEQVSLKSNESLIVKAKGWTNLLRMQTVLRIHFKTFLLYLKMVIAS